MADELPLARSVDLTNPPVEARPVPPAGRKFPCPSCGARLDFDPTANGLKCPYCGYAQIIERGDGDDIVERDYLEYLDREEAQSQAIPGRSTETRCTGCGAVVLLEDRVATESCPFCMTHLEHTPEAAHAMIPPESVLPFAIDYRQARTAYETWLKSLWFAPSELTRIATLGQLTGIYLPYWTYDAMTSTYYLGQRGINYTVTVNDTSRDAQGNLVNTTRTETRIRWTDVSGHVQHFFDDVLVCASQSLPEDLIAWLSPWALAKLVPFQPEFLSGFKTERYGINLKEGMDRARAIMKPIIMELVKRDIGGDHQRVSDHKTKYSALTFKPLLLPIWIAVYRYHDKTYQILINGGSGKVAGYRPWSTWKIVRLILLILIGLIGSGLAVAWLGKK